MKNMKPTYTFPILLATLLLASCGGDSKEQHPGQNPVAVEVITAGGAADGASFTASGRIEAAQQANLGTRSMGYVKQLHVKVGDKVSKGQLLVSLDNADLQAKLAQVEAAITEAEAAFANAGKDYERYQALFADQSATQKELDDMTSRYRMAQARLEAARQMRNEVEAQFAYARIRAPFAGVVTNTFAEAGDLASPGHPLVAVEAPGAFEVKAQIPENEISQVAEGDPAAVLVKSLGKQLKGTVSELSTSARNTGGQYQATIRLEEGDPALRSGMYATLRFERKAEAGTADTLLLIPSGALVHRGQLSGIYTVSQSNTALLRWLRLGRTYGDQVEVLAGLSPGETYVVSADSKLYNGAPLQIQ